MLFREFFICWMITTVFSFGFKTEGKYYDAASFSVYKPSTCHMPSPGLGSFYPILSLCPETKVTFQKYYFHLVHCWWECKLVQSLWKTVWSFLKKLKIELPYDSAAPSWVYIWKKTKTLIQKHTCTPVFLETLFTIAKLWKQPMCPSTDEWIKMMWYIYIYIYIYIYTHIYIHTHTHTKRNTTHKKEWILAICSNRDGLGGHYAKWNKSDRGRQILYDMTYMWSLKKIQMNLFTKPKQTHRHRKQTYGYQRGRGGVNWEFGINRYPVLYIK